MSKAASPIRLQEELMQSAKIAAARSHRSATEQVEYWTSLGRSVADILDTDSILAVRSGLAHLKVENIETPVIDPDTVFTALEQDRQSGDLAETVTESSIRYQACRSHPGQLEQINSDGKITIGQFANGNFIPMKPVSE